METTETKPLTHFYRVAKTIQAGHVFGNWTVVKYVSTVSGKTRWLCRCVCGNEVSVLQQTLTKGTSKGCGCDKDHHGDTRENPEYMSWLCMKSRCLNPRNTEYHRYGGRGVRICDRWRRYSDFLFDMGRAPEGKNTLDRIDPNGNYEPSNCRWASIKEQLRNKRNTIFVEFNGEKKPLSTWCELLGMKYNIVHHRQKYGLKTPFEKQFNNHLCQTQ